MKNASVNNNTDLFHYPFIIQLFKNLFPEKFLNLFSSVFTEYH